MKYVCHKVGILFPLCESCKTHTECLAEAEKQPQPTEAQEITVTQ